MPSKTPGRGLQNGKPMKVESNKEAGQQQPRIEKIIMLPDAILQRTSGLIMNVLNSSSFI
jgi:hypothetical protein